MQRNATRPNLAVTTGGKGVAAHAGRGCCANWPMSSGWDNGSQRPWRRPSSADGAMTGPGARRSGRGHR
jgi:hypothetical protein